MKELKDLNLQEQKLPTRKPLRKWLIIALKIFLVLFVLYLLLISFLIWASMRD